MKSINTLADGWLLRKVEDGTADDQLWDLLSQEGSGREQTLPIRQMPANVYDVLLDHGLIENPCLQGDGESCQWVGESDWVYGCTFSAGDCMSGAELTFEGLDAPADIFLNGVRIARHEDAYFPCRVPVTDRLQETNRLLVRFHSLAAALREVPLPQGLEKRIAPAARLRAFGTTFGDYLGPKPCLMRMGVTGKVSLCCFDRARITRDRFRTLIQDDLKEAKLEASFSCAGETEGCSLRIFLHAPDGTLLEERQAESGCAEFLLRDPALWWPRSHGGQPLYLLRAELVGADGVLLDRLDRRIGLRRIDKVGDFDFRINNRPLRLWGSNLAPLDSMSGVYRPQKMEQLLLRVVLSHQNCLRVWGENERLDEAFYDRCDELGILIWQDFFTCYSMYPTNVARLDLMRREAEEQVLRLRHHPCILLWCGGNESLMNRDYDFPGERFLGRELFDRIFPDVAAQLDPDRYFHISSPSGGNYANDPLAGDTHGYTHLWYVPGNEYPVFLSENCRVSAPAARSMRRMMKPEDLWPEGYDGRLAKNQLYPWPESWNRYNSNEGYIKLGEVENYYDATDLESLLYRIGWGHADYIRGRVERYRRGKLTADGVQRRTRGHLLWKLNNSSNHIFFGVLDYFLEPYIPFYALRRAYSPLLLSFEIGDHIRLWFTNDTPETVEGVVCVGLFDPWKNQTVQQMQIPYRLLPDESAVLCSLDSFGQFRRSLILYARAFDGAGNPAAESVDYADIERHLRFPEDGQITLWQEGEDLLLRADRYIRSVELLAEGDAFGWLFEDNYFDLLPGWIKRVRVLSHPGDGAVTAKGYYCRESARIFYRGGAEN